MSLAAPLAGPTLADRVIPRTLVTDVALVAAGAGLLLLLVRMPNSGLELALALVQTTVHILVFVMPISGLPRWHRQVLYVVNLLICVRGVVAVSLVIIIEFIITLVLFILIFIHSVSIFWSIGIQLVNFSVCFFLGRFS